MIKSMTGYGLASTDLNNAKYTVEIKSLNSKFLELNLKLPRAFSEKELFIRNECSKLIERGKVSLSINIEQAEDLAKGANINTTLLKAYFEQLKNVSVELNANDTNLLQMALSLPEVIKYDNESVTEEEWNVLYRAFENAMKNFNTFREDEGSVLEKDLVLRISNILSFLTQVEKQEPNRMTTVRERLDQFLSDSIAKEHIDHNRFEQELIYYIDKLDITEEKIRLKSHCDYFIGTLKNKDANGKKLGFISQEIGREINTLGAKANDAHIQQLVVGMKEELEKIKEQLLNVL